MTFSERMREIVNQGVVASKDILSKAASQAQTWGEMGVLKVEIIQLRSQAEKLVASLGAEVYAALGERGGSLVSADTPRVADLVGRIRDLGTLIEEKEAAFKRLGGKESDLDKGEPQS